MKSPRRQRDVDYYRSQPIWKPPSAFCRGAEGWVYAVREVGTPLLKIGATKNPRLASRLDGLRWSMKESFILIAAGFVSHSVHTVEHYIQWALRCQRIYNDWFYLWLSPLEFSQLLAQATSAVTQHWQFHDPSAPSCLLHRVVSPGIPFSEEASCHSVVR